VVVGEKLSRKSQVKDRDGTLHIIPVEGGITRIHLNLRKTLSIKAEIKGETIQGTYEKGMEWIGHQWSSTG